MPIDVTSLFGRRADNRWDRCSVGDLFERVALACPEAEALVGAYGAVAGPTHERLSYGEADVLANRFANGLLDRGLRRGDRVLFVCDNSVEAYVAKIGVAKAGCVAVPLNPNQTPDVLAHAVALTEPALVVADAEYRSLPDRAGVSVDVTIPIGGVTAEGGVDFAGFCAAQPATAPEVTIHGDDIWQILFTSGTTAMPKGAMLSHHYSYFAAHSWALSFTRGLDHESQLRVACFTPILFHVGDQAYSMPALVTGGSIVLGRRFNPVALAAAVRQERATTVICGGLELAKTLLAEMEALGPAAMSSLTCLVYGLQIADPETVARIERLCPDVSVLGICGQTESVSGHRFVPGVFREKYEEVSRRGVNLVGRPVPLLASKPVSTVDGSDVPPGEVGELVYRSPVTMAGYYQDEDATRRAFDGGWFHSGDLGSTEPGGERLVVGRSKEMIKTGGENVASARVEAVVAQHPAVERVAVIGMPDEKWGEAVTAVVVPAEGAGVDAAEIIAFARQRLAGYETPKRVHIVAELPTDFVGKVRKYVLREMLLKG